MLDILYTVIEILSFPNFNIYGHIVRSGHDRAIPITAVELAWLSLYESDVSFLWYTFVWHFGCTQQIRKIYWAIWHWVIQKWNKTLSEQTLVVIFGFSTLKLPYIKSILLEFHRLDHRTLGRASFEGVKSRHFSKT